MSSSRAQQASEVAVLGLGLFVPELSGVPAWLEQARDPSKAAPGGTLIKPRDRRRTSALTKALADAYAEALTASGAPPAEVSSVFGSALGEAATMIGLLDQMWRDRSALSPMRFVSSVHNAAAGVISISTENRGFTTSIGADYDTPAMALAEGVGLVLAHGQPVIVCCGDEPVPGDLVPVDLVWELLAAAIAIGPIESAPPGSVALSMPSILGTDDASSRSVAASLAPPELPIALARNPNVGLLDLIDALANEREGTLRLDRGRGQGFSVTLRRHGETP